MKNLLTSVATMICLAACATGYQEQGFTGGFHETQLAPDAFRVTFKGNAYTSKERAADFTLLRSAELALENGFSYFIIVDSEQYTKVGTYKTPTTSQTTASVYSTDSFASGTATTTTSGGQTYIASKPRSTNTILCFREKPETGVLIYDAAYLANSLRSKYDLVE